MKTIVEEQPDSFVYFPKDLLLAMLELIEGYARMEQFAPKDEKWLAASKKYNAMAAKYTRQF